MKNNMFVRAIRTLFELEIEFKSNLESGLNEKVLYGDKKCQDYEFCILEL